MEKMEGALSSNLNDVMPIILSYLSLDGLKAFRAVCRKWRDVLMSTLGPFGRVCANAGHDDINFALNGCSDALIRAMFGPKIAQCLLMHRRVDALGDGRACFRGPKCWRQNYSNEGLMYWAAYMDYLPIIEWMDPIVCEPDIYIDIFKPVYLTAARYGSMNVLEWAIDGMNDDPMPWPEPYTEMEKHAIKGRSFPAIKLVAEYDVRVFIQNEELVTKYCDKQVINWLVEQCFELEDEEWLFELYLLALRNYKKNKSLRDIIDISALKSMHNYCRNRFPIYDYIDATQTIMKYSSRKIFLEWIELTGINISHFARHIIRDIMYECDTWALDVLKQSGRNIQPNAGECVFMIYNGNAKGLRWLIRNGYKVRCRPVWFYDFLNDSNLYAIKIWIKAGISLPKEPINVTQLVKDDNYAVINYLVKQGIKVKS